MNPSLVQLPQDYSIPEKHLVDRLRRIDGASRADAFIDALGMTSGSWRRLMDGNAVRTSTLNIVIGALKHLDDCLPR